MKQLKEAFVIIKCFGGHDDFFQGVISLDKNKLDIECKRLNDETNNEFAEQMGKKNIPYTPMTIFEVMDLEDAIKRFEDEVADYFTPDDESR